MHIPFVCASRVCVCSCVCELYAQAVFGQEVCLQVAAGCFCMGVCTHACACQFVGLQAVCTRTVQVCSLFASFECVRA